jgi:hypothetical protein
MANSQAVDGFGKVRLVNGVQITIGETVDSQYSV